MKIEFNTDKSGKPAAFFADKIATALSRYENRIDWITVHLADENDAGNSPFKRRCILEAQPAGTDPIIVDCQAATKEQAVNGAIIKLKTAMEFTK